MRLTALILFTLIAAILIHPATTEAQQVEINAETGLTWFSRNDVRIPNQDGTDFDMLGLIGTGVSPYLRLSASVTLGDRHIIRALLAPLSKTGTGQFAEEVFFEETMFEAGVPTDGTYKFNNYRLTYRYTFYNSRGWVLGAGAAVLVRDAKVELVQPGRSDSNKDLGFVPLLHIYAERAISDRASLVLDGEGLAATQGRAADASLTLDFKLSDRWGARAGYRLLEGGADVDEVYNFAWINFGLVGIQLKL
jgi:hypothetical protein